MKYKEELNFDQGYIQEFNWKTHPHLFKLPLKLRFVAACLSTCVSVVRGLVCAKKVPEIELILWPDTS